MIPIFLRHKEAQQTFRWIFSDEITDILFIFRYLLG